MKMNLPLLLLVVCTLVRGQSESSMVTVTVDYQGGSMVTHIPVKYLNAAGCDYNGQPLQAGQSIRLQQSEVPPCLNGALQSYITDLRSAIVQHRGELQEISKEIGQSSGGLLDLNVNGLLQNLTGVLDLTGTLNSLNVLELGNLLNSLDPLVHSLGSTVTALSGSLGLLNEGLGDLTTGLGGLLGGTLRSLGGVVSGLGNAVGGLGGALTEGTKGLSGVLGGLGGGLQGTLQNVGTGLQGLSLGGLLGRR